LFTHESLREKQSVSTAHSTHFPATHALVFAAKQSDATVHEVLLTLTHVLSVHS
jgi:hypothetical protein